LIVFQKPAAELSRKIILPVVCFILFLATWDAACEYRFIDFGAHDPTGFVIESMILVAHRTFYG
jgi:hypothetical protein